MFQSVFREATLSEIPEILRTIANCLEEGSFSVVSWVPRGRDDNHDGQPTLWMQLQFNFVPACMRDELIDHVLNEPLPGHEGPNHESDETSI